jgi:formylmethanofuran dehydrogenase subunit B
LLSGLRALIRGRAVDPARLEVATGRSLDSWADLARRLASARFGVVATGPVFDCNASIAECEALERLIADVNAYGSGRCVGCALGAGGNRAGLEAVLGWQAGAPGPVDFARGIPRYLPFDAEPAWRFEPGQDVVVLGIGPHSDAVEKAISSSRDVLWFQIGYDATMVKPGGRVPDVAIASAHPWLEAGGTVMRGDGVCLPVTPLFRARRPPEAWFLNRLCRKIEKRRAER